MGKQQVVRLNINTRSYWGARKLRKYLEQGWVVQSEQRRGFFEWGAGTTDFIFTRNTAPRVIEIEIRRIAEDSDTDNEIPPSTWLPR